MNFIFLCLNKVFYKKVWWTSPTLMIIQNTSNTLKNSSCAIYRIPNLAMFKKPKTHFCFFFSYKKSMKHSSYGADFIGMSQKGQKPSEYAIWSQSITAILKKWPKPIFCLMFLIKKYEGLVYSIWFYQNMFKGSKTFGVCNFKSIWYIYLDKRIIICFF